MLIAAVVIAFIIVRLSIKLERARDEIQIQNVQISTLNDSVFSYQNKSGELVAKINSVQVEKDNLKEALSVAGFDIQRLKDDNVKWRNINMALTAQIEAVGSVTTTVTDTFLITNTDTVWYTRINDWNNNHLSIYNGMIQNSNLNFDYTYKVGLKSTTENKKKEAIVTITLDDPMAKITNANSITIDKTKRFYEKWWFWTTIGITGGVLIAK